MIRKKVVFLPYDMDTAIGINNSGLLVFSYNLEDTDLQQGGEFIFNGQDSVLWTNLRDAFGDQIKTMYQNLRSQGKLSYALVERMFEEHQAKWSEAIFNEDAFFKYIEPLINPDEGKQPDASYLPMAQGSKAEQRKWWLYNRFRYMDSKWNAGDALTDYIMMRAYSVAPQVLTPYADIYLTTSWDGELTQVRAHRGQTYTLPCPKDSANDAVVAIYSASQLASVGDLSGLKIKNGNFSMATRLQELKIGDSASTYSNTNLIDLQLGNNTLLRTIDVRNCPNLAITVDLSGCKNIENVYFDGTGIAGVVLPNGGVLTTLHLPDTVTNLTVQNQPNITDFVLNDASNLSTLRLENCGELMDDAKELVAEMEGGSRIRLIGINWEFPTSQQLSDLYDLLDTMRGLDESGGNMPKVQISGVINVEYFSGDMAAMRERYPNVRITADHTSSVIYFYNGSTLITQQTVLDGGDATYSGSTPTKAQDAQYTYSFAGWSMDDDNTVDSDALKAVTADRNVYACFTGTLRKYTVTFVKSSTDGGGTLQTISNVDYGTVITAASAYTGSTPTTSQGSAEDYPFEGWEPASATVQGNTTFTAKFGSPVVVEEISDSWDTIIANIDNGTYSTKYKVGNYKPLDLGTEGTINMQIVAMDADELADGSGYAPLTFIGMELLTTSHRMNPSRSGSSGAYTEGTGSIGGWEKCEMRTYLKNTIKPLIPSAVRSRINSVIKYSRIYNTAGSLVNDVSSTEDVWLPSIREIFGKTETQGPIYSSAFPDAASCVKSKVDESNASFWWCRSATNGSAFQGVDNNGTTGSSATNNSRALALGFCLGLEPETITDSWETILANPNYATDYSIGDTKMIDLGTEGKHLMEIVAFDEDDRADGNGKAGITWISKDLLNTTYRMNPANSSNAIGTGGNGGWEHCEMRTYLKDTIKPLIPETVRNAIVPVTKVQSTVTDGTMVKDGQTTTDDVWIPSAHEVGTSNNYESTGAVYTGKFDSASARIKKLNDSAGYWWTRSATSTMYWRRVNIDGGGNNAVPAAILGIALGFCTN